MAAANSIANQVRQRYWGASSGGPRRMVPRLLKATTRAKMTKPETSAT